MPDIKVFWANKHNFICINTLGGGVLFYVRDTFNANKLVDFSVMLEHLETIFVYFSVGKINYVIGNVYLLLVQIMTNLCLNFQIFLIMP